GPNKVSYSSLLGNYIDTSNAALGNAADANKKAKFQEDFKLKKEENTDPDAFQRETGHYWYINEGRKEAITANYGADSNLKQVYTTEVTYGDIYSLLGKDAIDKAVDNAVTVYVDGETGIDTDDGKDDLDRTISTNYTKGESTVIGDTGNGVETYVYQKWNDDGNESTITIVIINTYLAKVDTVNEATNKKDREIELTLVDADDAASVNAALTKTTDEFDEGDYVLINISKPSDSADGAVETVVPATVLKTEVSRVTRKGDKVTLVADGTTYSTAKKTADDDTIKAADKNNITNKMVDGKDHTLYIDNHGYVIGIADVTAASDYVYVAAFGYKNNGGDDLTDKGVFQADIYYADGSHKIVAIDKTNKADGSGGTATSDAENYFYNTTVTDADDANELNKDGNNEAVGLYKLDTYKGKAILTKVDATDGKAGQFISRNHNNIFGSSTKMDSKTVFFYVSGEYGKDSWSVVTYTGIGSVPVGKNGETDVDEYIAEDDDVKAVTVDDKNGGEDGKVIYLYLGTNEDYSKSGKEVTYNFWKDGKLDAQTITYKDGDAADDAIDGAGTGFVTVSTKGDINNPDADGTKKYIVSDKVGYIYNATVVAAITGETTTATFTFAGGKAINLAVAGLKPIDLIDCGCTTLKALLSSDYTGYKVAVVFNETGGEATAIYIVDEPDD
ncbi:MAG: hypothetical protein NC319_09320, partial [Butyricicoccus sp.]|nr:hypothetical protein [Butyricicoccus sp.]